MLFDVVGCGILWEGWAGCRQSICAVWWASTHRGHVCTARQRSVFQVGLVHAYVCRDVKDDWYLVIWLWLLKHACLSEADASGSHRNALCTHRPKEWQVLSTVLLRLLGYSVSTAARPQRQLKALFRRAKVLPVVVMCFARVISQRCRKLWRVAVWWLLEHFHDSFLPTRIHTWRSYSSDVTHSRNSFPKRMSKYCSNDFASIHWTRHRRPR